MTNLDTVLREHVLEVLSAHRAELRGLGVSALSLFGSVARGGEHPDSDVDILVELDKHCGLLALMRVRLLLEKLLGRRVDVVTRGGLAPDVLAAVERDALRVA